MITKHFSKPRDRDIEKEEDSDGEVTNLDSIMFSRVRGGVDQAVGRA